MKKGVLFIILMLAAWGSYGQGWEWAKTGNCLTSRASDLGMIAYDRVSSSPGLYTTLGFLGDSICFDHFIIHNTKDSLQILIAKHDTAGNFLWALGSSNGQCVPRNISTDAEGNLFILGVLYTDSVSFEGHTLVNPDYVPGGGFSINHCFFILKLDPLGNVLMFKYCGTGVGSYEMLVIGGITIDASRNIYISGTFNDSVLKVGTHIFPNTHKDSGDIFILKLDPSGNYVWTKTFGGNGCDYGEKILVSTDNKLYLSGWFTSSTLTIGSTTLHHSGWMAGYYRPDAFIMELDIDGNPIWAKCSIGNSIGYGFALDKANNIYMTGSIIDTSFAFGAYSFSNPNLYWGGFILKFDTSGNTVWGKSFYPLRSHTGGLYDITFLDVITDPCNNIWVSGSIGHDSVGMNGATFVNIVPVGGDPLIFAGFDSMGTLLQRVILPSGGDDNAGLASDCWGNIYFAGDFSGKVVFGSDSLYIPGGSENMFIAKYNPNLGCTAVCSGVPEKQESLSRDQSITLYPNPSVNSFTISGLSSPGAVSIYDLAGRLIHTYSLTGNNTTISILDLSPGMYVCRIDVDGSGVVSKKLVVMR